MPAPAAGRPSACCRRVRPRCSATMTARRCRPTSCTTRPAASWPRVLAERNDGFVQMLLVSGDNARDQAFYEEVATLSGRPVIMNVVQAFDHKPHIHRRVLDWLKSCRERGIRVVGPGPHDRRRLHLHLRGVEPVRRFPGVVRGHDGNARRAPGQARRSGAPRGVARQAADHRDRAAAADRHRRPAAREEQEVARLHAGPCRREDGQASGRRHARHGGRGGSQDRVLRRPAQRQDRAPEGAGRRSLCAVRRVRRRRPHQVPDGRPLSDRNAVQGGARAQDAEPGGRALAPVAPCRPRSRASAAAAC